MYHQLVNRLETLGVQVIEETIDNSIGYCTISHSIPKIYISKGLDDVNKISVLLHESVHASTFWTKRNWWMEYRCTSNQRYMIMEEAIALWHQKEMIQSMGLDGTYSHDLSVKLFKKFSSKLTPSDIRVIKKENALISKWLYKTFLGINYDLDRYLYKIASLSSANSRGNINTRANSNDSERYCNVSFV
jgi:hypothetical protein